MALIVCKECGKEYSDKATACIHCGCPTQETKIITETSAPQIVSMGYGKFATIFIIAMIPTYLLRGSYLFNSFQNLGDLAAISSQGDAMNWLMVLCYIIMVGITYKRSKSLDKSYLTVFPVLSGIFDIVLIFIPLVPTLLNILTLILIQPKGVEVVQDSKTSISDESATPWDNPDQQSTTVRLASDTKFKIHRGWWVVSLFVIASLFFIANYQSNRDLSQSDKVNLCKAYIGELFHQPTSNIENYKNDGNLVYVRYERHSDKTTWGYACNVNNERMLWTAWILDKQDWGRWRYEDEVKLNSSNDSSLITFVMPDTKKNVSVSVN